MGVWEKVEAAGFPVKIGASLTWGASADRWNFDFYPVEEWKDEPRPAKYEGQRFLRSDADVQRTLAEAGRADLVRWNVDEPSSSDE